MNLAKAALFDAEATAPWATAPYGDQDQPKIARLLAAAELGVGAHVLEPGCGTGRLTAILAATVGPQGPAAALGEQDRVALLDRLHRARALFGGVDALQRFLNWKAPEER